MYSRSDGGVGVKTGQRFENAMLYAGAGFNCVGCVVYWALWSTQSPSRPVTYLGDTWLPGLVAVGFWSVGAFLSLPSLGYCFVKVRGSPLAKFVCLASMLSWATFPLHDLLR